MDDIPTVKFVYFQWVGENIKPMQKAQASTHKGGVEDVFKVSSTPVLPSYIQSHVSYIQ